MKTSSSPARAASGEVPGDLRAAVRTAVARRSDAQGLLWLARHLAFVTLAVAGVVATRGSWVFWPALWLLGVTVVTLFAPLHECIHGTAFKHRGLNRVVAAGCGALLIISPTWFRAFHFNHHRYTQDPDRDPELARPKPRTRWQYLRHLSGLPAWSAALRTAARLALHREQPAWLTERERHLAGWEARCALLLYASVAVLATDAFLLWAGALLLGEPVRRAWLLTEHTGCALAPDMWRNTRTVVSLPILRVLTWQMGYHNVHHAWPGVPFHALGEIDTLIEERVEQREPGYVATHRRLYGALTDTPARLPARET